MNDNEDGQNTNTEGEGSTESTGGKPINSASPSREIEPTQPPKPPTAPPENLRRNETRKEGEYDKDSHKEISVKLVKEALMTPFEQRSFWLSMFTLLILVATFIVFYLQLRESKNQTGIFRGQAEQTVLDAVKAREQTNQQIGIAKDQFRMDQRPVIWLSNMQENNKLFEVGQVTPSSQKQVLSTWHYTNFGKSPAFNIVASRILVTGAKSNERLQFAPTGTKTHLLLPNGKEDFFTAVSHPVKDSDLAEITKDNGVTMGARFKYSDSQGNIYETDICMTRLQTQAWAFCGKGNDIKDCSQVHCDK